MARLPQKYDRRLRKVLGYRAVWEPGANISRGRNLAIAAAAGPIIAATDAGVVLSPYWLEDIVRPIEAGEAPVASGWVRVAGREGRYRLAGFDLNAKRSGKRSQTAVPVISKRGNTDLLIVIE